MNKPRVAGYFRVATADQLADSVTFEDLSVHFFTGRSILLSGSGRDKKYSYRSGVMTDVGDIELSRNAPMEAAIPTQMVATSHLMYCMVS